jgi:hypothetical protein
MQSTVTEVASPSQPRHIPPAGLTLSPPTSLGVAPATRGVRNSGHLTLDTFSPVNQNGSFDFDRIVKSGKVLKRTRKTKVCCNAPSLISHVSPILRICDSHGNPYS